MTRNLSKSRYQKGLQCEKALWLSIHRPDLAPAVTEAQQWIFTQGHEVGLVARGLFPGGVEVAEDHLHAAEALARTAQLLANGATVLYEPAFQFGGAFARVDILVAAPGGRWDLYEVKSSTALKDVYITDAALQAYAVEGSGLALRSVNIVRINNTYVYQGGEYDLSQLFAVEDITGLVREYLPQIPGAIAAFQQMLDGPEPERRLGNQCGHPYQCDYCGYCHSFLPDEFPVTDLPRLSEAMLHALLDQGYTCLLDVPEGYPGLTRAQAESLAAVHRQEPVVDAEALRTSLRGLRWPVYHLDFETVNPALPLWPGTRPYQQVPFQYSIHVHYPDGSTRHREYLHVGTEDPRRSLARRLLADCGRRGSVVHYTSYERQQIDALIAALPDFAPELEHLRRRLFDLEPPIRLHTRHPFAVGRSSIKYVLPAWCPDLSYDRMSIGDGQTAAARYLAVLLGRADSAERAQILADLREYCALDTLAMVRLLDHMRGLAGAEQAE
jgi:hypothetical protein